MPVRKLIVRTPTSLAAWQDSSHLAQMSGKKPSPGVEVSSNSSSPRSPYQPTALATMNASGFLVSCVIAFANNAVLFVRLSSINFIRFFDHRLSPIPAPPKWIIASKPSKTS